MYHRNIYGDKLQPCSSSGMALAGTTSSGYCLEHNDESKSHHICMNLSSNSNFCSMANENRDWCSDEKVCDDGYGKNTKNGEMCPIENWCTCQWSFATYVQNMGGCDFVQDLQCDAIHIQTMTDYVSIIASRNDQNDRIANALDCLISKCGIIDASETLTQMYSSSQQSSNGHQTMAVIFSIFIIGVAGYAMYQFCFKAHLEEEIIMNTDDPNDYFAMGKTLWKGKWIETACF